MPDRPMPVGPDVVTWSPRVGDEGDDRYAWPETCPLMAGSIFDQDTGALLFDTSVEPSLEISNKLSGINQLLYEINRQYPLDNQSPAVGGIYPGSIEYGTIIGATPLPANLAKARPFRFYQGLDDIADLLANPGGVSQRIYGLAWLRQYPPVDTPSPLGALRTPQLSMNRYPWQAPMFQELLDHMRRKIDLIRYWEREPPFPWTYNSFIYPSYPLRYTYPYTKPAYWSLWPTTPFRCTSMPLQAIAEMRKALSKDYITVWPLWQQVNGQTGVHSQWFIRKLWDGYFGLPCSAPWPQTAPRVYTGAEMAQQALLCNAQQLIPNGETQDCIQNMSFVGSEWSVGWTGQPQVSNVVTAQVSTSLSSYYVSQAAAAERMVFCFKLPRYLPGNYSTTRLRFLGRYAYSRSAVQGEIPLPDPRYPGYPLPAPKSNQLLVEELQGMSGLPFDSFCNNLINKIGSQIGGIAVSEIDNSGYNNGSGPDPWQIFLKEMNINKSFAVNDYAVLRLVLDNSLTHAMHDGTGCWGLDQNYGNDWWIDQVSEEVIFSPMSLVIPTSGVNWGGYGGSGASAYVDIYDNRSSSEERPPQSPPQIRLYVT